MKATLYRQDGSKARDIQLDETMFNVPWNDELVHQAVVAIEKNRRIPIAHTKDRSEVRGGGRKPWRQKGTGRARHGSIRSPIWRGGGVTFGPRNSKVFWVAINRKMKTKAFLTALSQKARDKKITFLESLELSHPSTRQATALIKKIFGISGKGKHECIVVLPEKNSIIRKSFANLSGISTITVESLNTWEVLVAKRIVFVNPDIALLTIKTRAAVLLRTPHENSI